MVVGGWIARYKMLRVSLLQRSPTPNFAGPRATPHSPIHYPPASQAWTLTSSAPGSVPLLRCGGIHRCVLRSCGRPCGIHRRDLRSSHRRGAGTLRRPRATPSAEEARAQARPRPAPAAIEHARRGCPREEEVPGSSSPCSPALRSCCPIRSARRDPPSGVGSPFARYPAPVPTTCGLPLLGSRAPKASPSARCRSSRDPAPRPPRPRPPSSSSTPSPSSPLAPSRLPSSRAYSPPPPSPPVPASPPPP